MLQWDRYWWVEALLACACGAGSVLAPVLALSSLLPLTEELGEPITADVLLGVGFGLVLLVGSVFFTISSARSLRRHRVRMRAIRSHADAMPAARIAVNPEKAPDVSARPLVLQWRATNGTRFAYGPLIGVYFLVAVASAGIYPVFYVIGWLQGTVDRWQDIVSLIVGLVSVICIMLLVLLARRAAPLFFGRPYGVTASAEGIEYRTELGSHGFLPWGEIRFLEVKLTSNASRNYMLYGAQTSVAWSEGAGANHGFSPVGVTPEEMTYRLQALLNLIAARTGLRPRTFSKRLQAIPAAGTESSASQPGASRVSGQQVGCAAFLVLFAAAPIALAVAVLRVPFSGIQALNDVMAASLCLTALLVVGVAVWTVATARRTPRAAGKYVIVSAPPSGTDTTKYTLAYAVPAGLRITFVISGVLLCLDTLPFAALAAASLVYQFIESIQPIFGGTPGHVEFPSFGMVVGYVMIPFAVGGPVLLWIGLRFATATIFADARGLTTHVLRQQRTLLWDSVEQVTATRKGDRIIGYAAKADRVQISWPADVGRVRPAAHAADVMPISPDELIALAAARTGKSVELLTLGKPSNVD
jgi:hypothetical protein